MITVSGLHVYPVKSCGGLSVDQAKVAATGLDLDRRWMVVGGDGKFVSQRQHPRLALVQVRLTDDQLVLAAPQMPQLDLSLEIGEGPAARVQVWDDECSAVDAGREAAGWFSEYLGSSARLVRMVEDDTRPLGASSAQPGDHVSFADGFPFLLISQASLDALNRKLSLPVPMDRFRPCFRADMARK